MASGPSFISEVSPSIDGGSGAPEVGMNWNRFHQGKLRCITWSSKVDEIHIKNASIVALAQQWGAAIDGAALLSP
jgi:hypothetical protein